MPQRDSSSTSFLPDFCGSRAVFVAVLLAELLAIVLTLAGAGSRPPLVALAFLSLLVQSVAVLCLAALCLLGPRLRMLPDMAAATLSYAITLGVSAAVIEIAWELRAFWAPPDTPDHGGFFLRGFSISAVAWALALRYFYVRHQLLRRIRSEAEARLQALQARIRPHFLFNCMNTIASLTRQTPRLAEEVVEDLSDLFRASLSDARQPSTLADELDLCRRYLRIEQHRLGERLRVDWQDMEADGGRPLPRLTLQPLLENAIYHGIEPLPGGGVIRIRAERRGTDLCVTIANPQPPGALSSHAGNRLAQDNVAQRLEAWYGRAGLLAVEQTDGEYRVTVTLPESHEDPHR